MGSKKRSRLSDDPLAKKIAWFFLSFLTLIIFFKGFPSRFIKIFSWNFIRREGAYPWVALSIGIIWLLLKRKEIGVLMIGQKISSRSITTGLLILFASISLNRRYSYLGIQFEVLFLLLSFLAFFIIFFKEAKAIPTILTALYGFTVTFPIIVSRYFEVKLSMVTLYTTLFVLKLLGFTTYNEGQMLHFIDNIGRSNTVLINSQCSGIASITIFIIFFVLMSLDMPLPKQKTAIFLALGIVGTYLQNIIRILSLIITGYFYGMDALWKTHSFAGYVIFLAWFAMFAFLYLSHAEKLRLEVNS